MKIKVNGVSKLIDANIQLSELIRIELNSKEAKGVAAAVNTKVVPRQQWESMTLNENDTVEIVHAVQGG